MNQLFLEAQLFRHHPIPFDDIIIGDLVIMWLTNMKQCLLTWPSQKLKRLSHSWNLHRNKITNIKTQVKTYNDTWTHRVPGRNCVRTLWEVFAAPAGGLGWVPNTEMGGHSSLWLLLQETSHSCPLTLLPSTNTRHTHGGAQCGAVTHRQANTHNTNNIKMKRQEWWWHTAIPRIWSRRITLRPA